MINTKNNYRVGIYTRLSNDDGTNEESVSIDTQKKKYLSHSQEWVFFFKTKNINIFKMLLKNQFMI